MTRFKWSRLVSPAVSMCALIALAGVLPLDVATAQDPFGGQDPFGASSSGDDPFGGAGDNTFQGGAPSISAEQAEAVTSDPLALQMLTQTYDDPVRRCIAAITLFNMGEASAATQLLQPLSTPLADAEALRLVRSVGSTNLFTMVNRDDFPADRKAWFQETASNAMMFATSQAHVSDLLSQLSASDAAVRQSAMDQLRVAGMAAAVPILNAMQQKIDVQAWDDLELKAMVAVVQQGSRLWDPALRSLAIVDTPIKDAAVLALAARRSDVHNAAVIIGQRYSSTELGPLKSIYGSWAKQFASDYGIHPEERQRLAAWIQNQVDQQQEFLRDLDAYRSSLPIWNQEVWLWQQELGDFAPMVPDRYEVPSRNLAQWAAALLQVNPEGKNVEEQFLVAQLQRAKVVAGRDLPLPQDAVDLTGQYADAARLQTMLKDQLEKGNHLACEAILESLAAIGDAQALELHNGRYPAVVNALSSPEARVRFQAALTILKWNPQHRFAGSSFFNSVLAELLNATIGSQVVTVSVNKSDAYFLNSLIRNDGWEAEIAQSSGQMFQVLNTHPISLIVLTDALDTEPYVSVVDRIRELPRGKTIPIALMVRPENFDVAEKMFRVYRSDRFTIVGRLDGDYQVVEKFLSEASLLAGQWDMPSSLKQRKTFEALKMLNQWLDSEIAVKNIDFAKIGPAVQALARNGKMGSLAVSLLAHHADPDTQLQLAQMAGNSSQTPENRAAAAVAFRRSVQRFGILLTSAEIMEQYDRQNQTERETGFSQEIMNSILDTLEARHKRVAFDQLPAIPVPQ